MILWSSYVDLMIIVWSSNGHLAIILWSSYDHLLIIFWSSYNHLMIILWSSYDHLMIVLWSSYDHLMIPILEEPLPTLVEHEPTIAVIGPYLVEQLILKDQPVYSHKYLRVNCSVWNRLTLKLITLQKRLLIEGLDFINLVTQ